MNFYADEIGKVSIDNGMIHVDFVALDRSVQSKDGKPNFYLTQRMVMPLQGFLRGVAAQETIVKKLIENGVLKVKSDDSKANKIE